LVQGFALTFLAGVVMGSALVPLKWIKAWKWENFWLVYSLMALVVMPVTLAFLLLPRLWSVYAELPANIMVRPFVFGAMWGVAQLGAGIAVHRIGLGLSISILNGICAASGTLLPLSIQHPELLLRRSGLLIIAGTVVMAIGLAFCGWAGNQRERATGQLKSAGSGYRGILALTVISGFLAALLNIALAFGGDIVKKVLEAGAAPAWAPFAVWPIALAGGFVVNGSYSLLLMSRNRTWSHFGGGLREVANPLLAGAMWMGAIALYSSATTLMGVLGVSVGWALFQVLMILTGNVAGMLTGEWRNVARSITRANLAGVLILLAALVLIGAANS
jgi:L-rhamnose-H+ transport protein